MMTKNSLKRVAILAREVADMADKMCEGVPDDRPWRVEVGTAASGALRRRSLDLTRALAAMRSSRRDDDAVTKTADMERT